MIALSVAGVLAIFLLYTSLAAGTTPMVQPSELRDHDGRVALGGKVVGPVTGEARGEGLRFVLRDVEGDGTVKVRYEGSVPDEFRVGREVIAEGELRNGTFVADRIVTKCPSKYTDKQA